MRPARILVHCVVYCGINSTTTTVGLSLSLARRGKNEKASDAVDHWMRKLDGSNGAIDRRDGSGVMVPSSGKMCGK